ncbi:MAG: NAD(+)/NADH kinase [Opitutae bacterium]
MKPLKKIALVINASKPGAEALALGLEQIAKENGVSTIVTSDFPCRPGFIEGTDACFVVGGDGTLLGMMNEAVQYNVPVAGIRHGKLGFLATFSPEEMDRILPVLFSGEYQVRQRSMIAYQEGGGESKFALNDLVIKSGSKGRLARFSVHVENERVADYACDGIVFSTPTGSTAYNLAAGGPIAHPDAQVVLMTPISAHSLTSRSVVFPAGVTLKVLALDNVDEPFISADGQPAFSKIPDFPIQISLARETFPLLEVNDHSHFRVLRNKLKWG